MKLKLSSIRLKLTASVILVVLLANTVLALITAIYLGRVFLEEVQMRVKLSLSAAKAGYNGQLEFMEKNLQAASIRRTFEHPIESVVEEEFGALLVMLQKQLNVDMLTLVNLDGNVVFRAHNQLYLHDNLMGISLIEKAVHERVSVVGTIVMEKDFLEREDPSLAGRVKIPIVEEEKDGANHLLSGTKSGIEDKARNLREGPFLNSGIALAVAVPLFSAKQVPMGVLFVATLLNHKVDTIETINKEAFQNQVSEGRDVGAATIFLGDIRVATSVKNRAGQLAVGTRLNAEVKHQVLELGRTWAGRTFIVDDWYLSAYEPLQDPNGRVIGALSVGLLEKPFARLQRIISVFFSIMIGLVALGSLVLIVMFVKKILGPMDHVIRTCRRLMDGDLQARVGLKSTGEMDVLCSTIDRMAEAIEKRENEIQENAQKQISQSEKLASIGRLAAGTAHEINNPLTGVLTFAHLLYKNKNIGEAEKKDLEVIINETTRMREIVRGLLDFAHQSVPQKEWVDLNELIQKATMLLKKQEEFRDVAFMECLKSDLPLIFGDKNQLQQVFFNLALNACEAIAKIGEVIISTSSEKSFVIVTISDTGAGIKKEHIDKIFDPFFTTKPVGKGTGLGLSVSYGNIEQHGGTIKVVTEEGHGTTFTVSIPIKSA